MKTILSNLALGLLFAVLFIQCTSAENNDFHLDVSDKLTSELKMSINLTHYNIIYDHSEIKEDPLYGQLRFLYYQNGVVGVQRLNENLERVFETAYYPDSTIKVESGYMDNNMHGYYKSYHPNGNVSLQGTYSNGIQEGWWEEFDKSGKLKWSGYLSNGEKNGFFKNYKKGVLLSEGSYRNNVKWGLWKYYNETGALQDIIEYD